jgi:F-type H+-transporting ATPase subunit b
MALLALALCVRTAPAEKPHDAGHAKAGQQGEEDTLQGELSKEAAEVNKDLFGWAMDLGIWTLVVFLILLFVLSKFAWKPMLQGLEHREKAIHSALHEAQAARDEAARLRTQFEEQMRKANDQSREILDEARRAAERTTAEMVADARKEIQTERERLQRELSFARDQALQEIRAQTAQLATLVSSKVIRRNLNVDDHRQLVDEALAELKQAGNDQIGRG